MDRIFYGKCAFCETKVADGAQAIDHFRPLGYASGIGDRSTSPDHYAWFAYEWKNLLLCCPTCTKNKANLFPVTGPRAPILCSFGEANKEEKFLLLDPTIDEPWRHLDFDNEGYCIPKSKRGNVTIQVFQLNRSELLALRKEKITECVGAIRILKYGAKLGARPLQDLLTPGSENSGAAIIFTRGFARYLAKKLHQPLPPGIKIITYLDSLVGVIPDALLENSISEYTDPIVRKNLTRVQNRPLVPVEHAYPTLKYLEKRHQISDHSRITKIEVRNFKGISSLSLSFSENQMGELSTPCMMIIGENSTGKSSLLQGIALCLMGEKKRTKLKLNPEDFISRNSSDWKLIGDSDASIEIFFESRESAKLNINPLARKFDGTFDPSTVILAYGARRFFTEKSKSGTSIESIRTMFFPLATISHPNTWIAGLDEEAFASVARAMREILALQYEDEVVRDGDGRVFVFAHGRQTPIDKLSDGYLSLFAMAIDIMREMLNTWGSLEVARGIVLIDEIETHLHPRWKMQVVGALRKALPNVQFIATTHDPLCLRGMNDSEVIVLHRSEGNTIKKLENLPPISGMRAEQILTSDYFGLASTSDANFEAQLNQLGVLARTPRRQMEEKDRDFASKLEKDVRSRLSIGDTAIEQILNEAMMHYLLERRDPGVVDRKTLREAAVADVLKALKESD
ncbi:AAA family ATPase [Massilia niastensis]|uniref:AAA family ATPase n=1 Tax=Massilia niastensis TaxID=544911 RepID=UPI00146BD446|nr:AAA family ATPase [Massilia niastensis]